MELIIIHYNSTDYTSNINTEPLDINTNPIESNTILIG